MATAKLPNLPKGKEFEEFIAAFLQTHGFFIERNIVDRQEEEVLELDVIASRYKPSEIPEYILFEMKSGEWGFGDIFKLKGWLEYLNIDRGCLVVQKPKSDFYRQIANSIDLDIVSIPDVDQAARFLEDYIDAEHVNQIDIATWRFSFWAERNLLKLLRNKKKSLKDRKSFKALERYYFLINNRIFFTRNIIKRAEKLYDAFRQFPHISAKVGNELVGNNFDDEHESIPQKIYSDTYYKCQLTDITISTFIEYRARLSIMKSAIDYKIYKSAGLEIKDHLKLRFGDHEIEISLLDILPDSFQNGLDIISKHIYFYLYPVFWQWFLWVFGGFILEDYKDQEYSILSQKTGIPVKYIDEAINAYELIFPRDEGWFMTSKHSNIKFLKLFPTPFLGIGANYRRLIYGNGDWDKLSLSGLYTKNDLIKWNNVLVELLTKDI